MSGIRPLAREDLPEVCSLYERVVRSGTPEHPLALEDYFARTLIDHPWFDEDIPSLVYETREGEIAGFLGSYARRMRLDGRAVRLGCSGQLVAAPEARHKGVGALLMRRYLAGPQDITITDGATDYVRRIWTGLGGRTDTAASIGWVKFLRPAQVGAFLSRRRGRRWLTRSIGFVGSPVDAAARRLAGRVPGVLPLEPQTFTEQLDAATLVEQVGSAARHLRLHPDYDTAYVDWLFEELAAVTFRGTPVRHLVRDVRGRVLGWYVYYLEPGSVAQVMQVAAPGGDMAAVLGHLFWHADSQGAAAVTGRVEAHTVSELHGNRCLLVPSEWSLVHSEDQSVLALLGTPETLLTRLDGEWWMGHHSLWLSTEAIAARLAAATP
ncbi:N-acetyltransferase family protein [Pseudonocardia sp.]|uniref:GNAT family N-acetyltransferase n=1 Tax=Pseudonocardia sp. TaxID=60912 RepID=UPI003D0B76DF